MRPLVQESTALARLQSLAKQHNVEPTLARLTALCCNSSDTRFLFSIISFLAERESIHTLAGWSTDNIHCRGLHDFAQTCWQEGELIRQARPFGPDQRVEKMFHQALEEQYLASMLASRRALPSDMVSTWLQVLRLYILVRALDALDDGAIRERHLQLVCVTVRYVCENAGHDRHPWIKTLIGSSTGFFEFENETVLHCHAARAHAVDTAEKSFFKALAVVLEHKPWAPLPVKVSANWQPVLQRYPHFNSGGPQPFHASMEAQPTTKWLVPAGGNLTQVVTQPTGSADSHCKRKFQGEGLRLETLERNLFLPHSWHHITDDEAVIVMARIEHLLKASDRLDKFGASVTLLALLTGQSINDVSKMRFGSSSGSDWRINFETKSIHRLAPRFTKRWRSPPAGEATASWVSPLSQIWAYKLAAAIAKPLTLALQASPGAASLDELWQVLGPQTTLSTWFGSVFTDQQFLKRLTAPSTSSLLSLKIFGQVQDHATARLLASDHRTALPAACAYGSYRGSEVARLLGDCVPTGLAQLVQPPISDRHNAAGSELDINLELLKKSIRSLIDHVNTAEKARSWCDHHNLLTSLAVLALLASTGARPVNSPFQSASWIDYERSLVYVEDKYAGPTQGSRICVLGDYARTLLQKVYLPHLSRLATALAEKVPAFADELGKVLAGDPEARLPMFFFVREAPSFDWMEVSESQLTCVCRFGWPLPWNLFRHFSATQLRRLGLHPDIRDALLGHAERDCESHGDFSSRIPLKDLEAARPMVNSLQNDLGFRLPDNAALPLRIEGPLEVERAILQSAKPFGRKAREFRRQQTHTSARTIAMQEVESLLAGRTVDQLQPQDLDAIAQRMLMRRDGLAHVMGSVRYEAFEDILAAQWRTKGKHAKLPHRYVLIQEGRAHFKEYAVTAHQSLARFTVDFENTVKPQSLTHGRPVLAAALAAIDLVVYSGLAHFPVICALLCNSQSIQLVRFQRRHWLEWGYGATWQDGKPVFRIEVTDRAAHWIAMASRGKSALNVPALPAALLPLCTGLQLQDISLGAMLRQLAALQSQKNALELPGFLAAYLSGSRPSSALPHADWIRTVKHAAPLPPATPAPAQARGATTVGEAQYFFRSHMTPPSRFDEPAMARCEALFRSVRNALTASQSNANIASLIAREVKTSGFGRGDVPFMLCHFIVHVLKRKPKHGGREHLRASTALRYWYSLSYAFLSVAANENWADVDEEELTQSYVQIVDAMASGPGNADKEENANASERAEAGLTDPDRAAPLRASDASSRTLIQLREFHEFARSTYGLPDPNWTEISSDLIVGVGRPGIVSIEEYLAALSMQLANQPIALIDDLSLSRAFVLLACARFGLRLGEAVGLLRADWVDIAGSVTVLVASNSVRDLKTTPSKRKVPLIEALTVLENDVVNAVLLRWNHRQGGDERTALLPGVSKQGFRSQKSNIASQLLTDIKHITHHDNSTVHALRHGFATRILALLLERPAISHTLADTKTAERARQLVLGSTQHDRRTLWAVARLLGHAGPGVTVRCYLDGMDLWLAPISSKPVNLPAPINLIDLDRIEVNHAYLARPRVQTTPALELPDGVLLRAIRFLRLLAVGQTQSQAETHSKLATHEVAALTARLNGAAAKLAPSPTRYESYKILSAISLARLSGLADRVGKAKLPTENPPVLSDWLATIGPSRHIILFEEHHFEAMASFVEAMGLAAGDVQLISKNSVHPETAGFVKGSGLEAYLKPKSEMRPTFQLDVARFGATSRVEPERVVAIVAPGGALASSFELLLLWVIWHFAVHLNNS